MKVFITGNIPEAGIDLLKESGFSVKVHRSISVLSKKALIKEVINVDALIPLLTDKIDAEVIDSMKKCKVIANHAVGYNNIDVDYAKKRGIVVTNTPDVLTDSTADLTIALALACTRRIREGEEMIRNKQFTGWHPRMLLGIELKNKIFGILGAGRIGSAVAKRAKAFGCRIIYFDTKRNAELEKETDAVKSTFHSLLKKSDLVSVHLPLSEETYHFLNKDNLSLLKKTAVLINTARGEIIEEKALIKLLKQKKIFAAGLDVYEGEPKINENLLKLKNAVLLPHIGSATHEARNGMATLAAKNVVKVLSGKKPVSPV